MPSSQQQNNIWARLRGAVAGQAIGNTYALLSTGGQFAPPTANLGNGRTYMVNGQAATNGDGLSWDTPFSTIAAALAVVSDYDTILLNGVIREQVAAPLGVFDVTIRGAANNPRQATSGGVPTTGGATWLAPTSPTALTPLLSIYEQAWTIDNIFFGTVASTPSLRLKGLETASFPDASHAIVSNCRFGTQALATEIGIGGWNLFNCIFFNNVFQGLSGTAILGEDVSIRTPSENQILYNYFRECANGINMPMNYGRIDGNRFKDVTTLQIDINVGADNYVGINFFDKTQANISIAQGFVGNASDMWRNYSSDTAALTVGVPA